MTCHAKVLMLIPGGDATTTHVGEIAFQRLPVAGEFIYQHDGLKGTESVYRVVAVMHEASAAGNPMTAEVYVRASSKLDFRAFLQNEA